MTQHYFQILIFVSTQHIFVYFYLYDQKTFSTFFIVIIHVIICSLFVAYLSRSVNKTKDKNISMGFLQCVLRMRTDSQAELFPVLEKEAYSKREGKS